MLAKNSQKILSSLSKNVIGQARLISQGKVSILGVVPLSMYLYFALGEIAGIFSQQSYQGSYFKRQFLVANLSPLAAKVQIW